MKRKIKQHAAVKSIVGIVLLLIVFSSIVSLIGYRSFTDALLDQYSEGAFLTAKTAGKHVDADRMDAYMQSGGTSDEYMAVYNELDSICNSSGATFIYVILPDRTDYAHITFLFSTIDHKTTYTQFDFGYVRETSNDEYKEKYRALYEKTSEQELVIRDNKDNATDKHITAMIGLKGTDGEVKGILCVQRQMDVLTSVRNSYLLKVLIVLIVLAVFVTIGQAIYLHRVLLRPLRLISSEALRFSFENTLRDKKLRDDIKTRDEIGQLASSIDDMEEQIHSYIDNITKITAEKERISTELTLASRIQSAMIPTTFPERDDFKLFASMDPAKEVGGDFYDFFMVDENHLCMVMADVSGKGVPAALFMMATKILFASNAKMGKAPAQILTDANTSICSNNKEDMFITVWLGILDLTSGKLVAANAGHEYPIIKKPDGEFELYKDKHGFVIGGMAGVKYKEYEINLEVGSKLFLYTDGVPEATNSSNELFGLDRTILALNKEMDKDPKTILKNVRESVDGFVSGAEQFDDLTMMLVEYNGKRENGDS